MFTLEAAYGLERKVSCNTTAARPATDRDDLPYLDCMFLRLGNHSEQPEGRPVLSAKHANLCGNGRFISPRNGEMLLEGTNC